MPAAWPESASPSPNDIRSPRSLFVGDYVTNLTGSTEGEVVEVTPSADNPLLIQIWEDGEPTTDLEHVSTFGVRLHPQGRA